MVNNQVLSKDPIQQRSIRLWPGIFAVLLQWLLRFGLPKILPGDTVMLVGVFAGMLGGVAVIVWWAFFSRAKGIERWGASILMIIAMLVTPQFLHESIATGNMGMMFIIYAIPVLSLAFVAWALITQDLNDRIRLITMVVAIFIACGGWTLLRSDGISGGGASADFTWRWTMTAEEKLLAQTDKELTSLLPADSRIENGIYWSGFRGPNRDGIIHGIRIETDWSKSPPEELWRRPVGPGCSSFAVLGNLMYTQEQRGEEELVSCYNLLSGQPVWSHKDEARFWDSHAGAGPRSTPTISNGRIYTFGATGILKVLNAHDGSEVWSRNAASDTDEEILSWGYTSSPLVVDDVVIVAVSGSLLAYDIATGNPRWFGSDGGESYSSPHLLTIDGVKQILLMCSNSVISVSPTDGKMLWEYSWPVGSRILQPALISDGNLLVNAGEGKGMRRITVKNGSGGWDVEERWTTTRMKPNFNDIVINKGYAFGFDGPSLVCIDLENGDRMWKGGRYRGFIMLLADQDLILVLSEKGEIALVEAVPDKFTELALLPAIEGKTWNHPALAGNILLVRNAREMVGFRLSLVE